MVAANVPRDGGLLAGFTPGTVVAGYRLEAQIGAGGMAVVFRARDEALYRTVALKILAPALAWDEEFRERFIRESRAAAAVEHPHIIPVYAAGNAENVLYIAMRLVTGGDLSAVVRREGPFAAGRAAGYVAAIASALDTAHGIGLVHRDIKPGNILIDSVSGLSDHVYLADFGLSKGMLSTGLTGTGSFFGTPDYCSPEQVNGSPIDGRTDQYALACVAYTLLAGGPPFRRDDPMATLLAHRLDPPPSLMAQRPELPAAVDEVIARGMAKSPADRYATCGEFAAAFRAALAGTVLVPVPDIAVPGSPAPGSTALGSMAPDSPAPGSTVPDGAYDLTRGVSVLEPAEQATPVGLDLGMATDPVTSSTRSRSSRLAGRRLAVVSATVATVLAAGGITAAVLAGSGAGEHATAASEPPTPTSSATRTPTPTPGTTFTPPAVTGLVKDAKSGLAYSRLSSPWANGCPAALSSRTTLTWTAGESAPGGHIAAIGGSHDLSAEACSGLLPGQYGYKGVPSLAPVAQQLATAFAGAYYPGLSHTFTQVTSKALPVSGRHAWEVGYRLDYPDAASLGLAFTSEDALVVVIDRGSQLPPVVFFASVPGNLGATQAVALVSSLTMTLPKPAAPSGGAGTRPVNGGGGNTGGNYNPTTNPTTRHPTANPTTKHPTTNPTTGGQTSPPPTFN